MSGPITIRTGTRDELGGIEIGLVNVFERVERPGRLSVQLVLPDRDVILAVGDDVAVGGRAYRLVVLTPARGAYEVTFEEVPPAPASIPQEAGNLAIPPVGAGELRALLRQLTPAILDHLAGGEAVPSLRDWTSETTQTTHTEWNGGLIGPNTHHIDRAQFAVVGEVGVEASITLDEIRYEPSEIYRREVSAYWRYGEAHAHIFLRAEGEARLDHITGVMLDPAILALIRGALAP